MTNEIIAAQPTGLEAVLQQPQVKKRFKDVLGLEAPEFISSILTVWQGKPELQNCEPNSIVYAAAMSASMHLSIMPAKGHACIVPYGRKAQFQIMARGWIQLALDTGKYATMHSGPVYEGELVSENHITGEYVFDIAKRSGPKVIGYCLYFRLLTGFEKYTYMTVEQLEAHGRRYSKSFHKPDGMWKKDFPMMAEKTVVKQGITKWGPTSPSITRAAKYDQAEIDKDDKPTYIDAVAVEGKPGERTYEMPKSKAQAKKTGGKKGKAAPEPEDAGGFEELKTKAFAKTDRNNQQVFVLKDADGKRFLTVLDGVPKLAKNAKAQGRPFMILTEDRPTGTNREQETWIIEARLG